MDALELLKFLAVDNPFARFIVVVVGIVAVGLALRTRWKNNEFDLQIFGNWAPVIGLIFLLAVYGARSDNTASNSPNWKTTITHDAKK